MTCVLVRTVSFGLVLSACSDGGAAPDARPGLPGDAAPGAPDAAPGAPDAAPGAAPGAPDAAAGGGVIINEIFAAGGDGEAYPTDWIELANTSGQPVNLAGYHLSDDESDLEKGTFPAGTSIAAGGYLFVEIADAEPFAFGLKAGGETVVLSDAAGNVLDSTTWPADGAGGGDDVQSWGRSPDGTGAFTSLAQPSPGAENE